MLGNEKLERFIRPEQAARLLAGLRRMAEFAENLPVVGASADDSDNQILATAIAGNANCVVTGDKGHLLSLNQVEGVPIITVKQAITLLDAQTP